MLELLILIEFSEISSLISRIIAKSILVSEWIKMRELNTKK